MTGSVALDRVLLVALAVAVAVSATRLAAGRRRPPGVLTGRDADVAHLVMNLGMAAALVPGGSATAHDVLPVVFGVLAAGFAGLLLAGVVLPALRARRSSHVYHLVAASVMAWATALMAPVGGPAEHGAHAGHGQAPALLVGFLVAVFAVDAVATALIVLVAPRRALAAAAAPADGATVLVGAPARDVTALRVAAGPHVVMDVAMVAMLLAL